MPICYKGGTGSDVEHNKREIRAASRREEKRREDKSRDGKTRQDMRHDEII